MKYRYITRKQVASAFTWFELLLVILIIALLVGILIPTPHSSHPASKSVLDLANLRQIGIALVCYAEDNDDLLPPHPRDIEEYFGDPSYLSRVYLNPYQEDDAVLDRGDSLGPALRYGGYVFLNLGSDLEEMEKPKDVILAYTAKVSHKQTNRNVLFADGHAEIWDEQRLRAALPPDIDVDALDGP